MPKLREVRKLNEAQATGIRGSAAHSKTFKNKITDMPESQCVNGIFHFHFAATP
jgi:hypothetical protein